MRLRLGHKIIGEVFDNRCLVHLTYSERVSSLADKEKNQRPVPLFVDGHTLHLVLNTNRFCNETAIIFLALLSNAI